MGNGVQAATSSPDTRRSVLVTGASSGIGACLADGLRAHGYFVVATARRHDDVARLAARGHCALQLDLTCASSVARAFEQTLQLTRGTLYALCNNAAYGQPGAVEDLTRDALREQFETNLFGTHDLTCRAVRVMRAQGAGRILQLSSLLGYVALPYRGAYTASKFALEGLTDTLRLELRQSGIAVILIEPGPIESAFRANALRALRRYVDCAGSVHRARYEGVIDRLQREGPAAPFTLPAEAVLRRVLHALDARSPRPRYRVTVPAQVFAALRRLLPTRALDQLLMRIGASEQRGAR